MPFLTESMYRNLVGSVDGGAESVHLEVFPQADAARVDQGLSDAMRLAMRISSLGRAARSKAGLKVRQPLEKGLVKLRSPEESRMLSQVAPQVVEELNVRELVPINEERQVLEFKVQPNMSLLGPKYGPALRNIVSALAAASPSEVYADVVSGRNVEIDGYTLAPEEVLVSGSDGEGYSVASEGGYVVAITTDVTPELKLEGLARELVHRIQSMRRSAGFDIADYIVTYYQGGPELDDVMATHGDYVRQETLSGRLLNDRPARGAYTETHRLNGIEATLGVKRVG